MGFIWGPTPVALAEVFPVRVRSTGVSLVYNLAVLVFGGLAPLILTALIEATSNPMVPAYYLVLSAIIGVAGCLLLRSTRPGSEHARGRLIAATAGVPRGPDGRRRPGPSPASGGTDPAGAGWRLARWGCGLVSAPRLRHVVAGSKREGGRWR